MTISEILIYLYLLPTFISIVALGFVIYYEEINPEDYNVLSIICPIINLVFLFWILFLLATGRKLGKDKL